MKKILPFVGSCLCSVLQGNPAVASPKEKLNEQMTSNPAFTEKNIQRLSPRFSSGSKIFGHVLHSTELVRTCLACQNFDFNSSDWISDNLHVITSWYLRTMGKEFIFQFSRRLWGRNALRTPKNVCVGGYGKYKRRGNFNTTEVPLHERVKQFPGENLIVRERKPFWSGCREIISSRKVSSKSIFRPRSLKTIKKG